MPPRPASTTPHSPPASSTSSNLRLFFVGLLLALLSILYPRLPQYLPPSVARHLPFLPSLPDTAHHTTWTNLQRYQQGVPVSPDYDPFDVKGQEEEYQLRVGSKEGGKEQEKQLKRQRREIERRTEFAGMENHVHRDLPVYFLQQGELVLPSARAVVARCSSSERKLQLTRLFLRRLLRARHCTQLAFGSDALPYRR